MIALMMVLLTATAADGDSVRVVGRSDRTAKRLVEIERRLAAPDEATLDELRRLDEEAGDDLVPSADGMSLRPARQGVKALLARLPAEGLRRYRDRVEPMARKAIAEGHKNPRAARRAVESYFPAKGTDELLLLLADAALERGDFPAAEQALSRLLPSEGGEAPFPDPEVDPAIVRAKLALVQFYRGDQDRFLRTVESIKTRHEGARGRIAGQEGDLVKILLSLETPPRTSLVDGGGRWHGYGGSPSRDGRVEGRLDHLRPSLPNWTWNSDAPKPLDSDNRPSRVHPVIVDGVLFLPSANRLRTFDAFSGDLLKNYDIDVEPEEMLPNGTPAGERDYTLTVSGRAVYGRFGPPAAGPERKTRSRIIRWQIGDQARAPLTQNWTLLPPPNSRWEGTPVAAEGGLFVVSARIEGNRTLRTLHRYADSEVPPERPLWALDLLDTPRPRTDNRQRDELLSYANGKLVYLSHAGGAAAVDAATGRVCWAFEYPRVDKSRGRDLAPPVIAEGIVLLAPADSDRLYFLELESGRLIRKSEPVQIEQILGVARRRVLCAVSAPQPGLRAYDLATGSCRGPEGWSVHDDPKLATRGRGLVSDELLLWPTNYGLEVLDPETGHRLRAPVRRPGGNLAYADGILISVSAGTVEGYRLRRETPRPETPQEKARFQIALAEEWLSRGGKAEAVKTLDALVASDFPADWRAFAARRRLMLAPGTIPKELLDQPVRESHGFPLSKKELPPKSSPRPEKKAELSRLGQGLRVVAEIPLPNSGVPLFSIDDSFQLAGERALFRRMGKEVEELDGNGKLKKKQIIDVDAHYFGEGVILGRNGITTWDGPLFQIPTTPSLPSSVAPALVMDDSPTELEDFQMVRGRIVARSANQLFVGSTDVPAHFCLHSLGPARIPFDGAPKIVQTVLLPEGLLVVSDRGRLRLLELESGRAIREFQRTGRLGDVVALPGKLLIAEAPNKVVRLNLVSGAVDTFYEAEHEASFTGNPPRLLLREGTLFVAMIRNHGVELGCYDADSRVRRWPKGRFLPCRIDPDLRRLVLDEERLYLPVDDGIVALDRADGRFLWRVPIGFRDLRLVRTATSLIAHSECSTASRPLLLEVRDVLLAFLRRPRWVGLVLMVAALHDVVIDREISFLVVDVEKGKVETKVSVARVGPLPGVRFERDRLLVLSWDRLTILGCP